MNGERLSETDTNLEQHALQGVKFQMFTKFNISIISKVTTWQLKHQVVLILEKVRDRANLGSPALQVVKF